MGMGTGKTLVALTLAQEYERPLIICPVKAGPVWEEQIEKHNISQAYLNQTHDKVANRVQVVQDTLKGGYPFGMIWNYDVINRINVKDTIRAFKPDIVILDESHRIKSHSSAMSKAAWHLGRLKSVKKRVCMTGTPYPNSPLDIFGQVRFLNDSVLKGKLKYWTHFRERYAVLDAVRGQPYVKKVVGYQNQEELGKMVAPLIYSVKTDDVLDLPPVVHYTRRVELPYEIRQAYRKFKRKKIAHFDDEVMTADNVLVKATRLQQMTSGIVKTDDGVERIIHNAKTNALQELLETVPQDKKVVIFCKFQPDIVRAKRLCDELGINAIEISGKRNEYRKFRGSDTTAAVVQIEAGAEALDLSEANYAIYYSNVYSLGVYEQSLARLRRPGSEKHDRIFVYHLVVPGTVDEVIYETLDKKRDVNLALTQYILG